MASSVPEDGPTRPSRPAAAEAQHRVGGSPMGASPAFSGATADDKVGTSVDYASVDYASFDPNEVDASEFDVFDDDGAELEPERSRAILVDDIRVTAVEKAAREEARRLVLVYASIVMGLVAFTWLGKTLDFVFTPLLAAWFICYLIIPVVNWLGVRKVPRWFGYVATIGLGAGVFYGVGLLVSSSVAQFRSNIGVYRANLDALLFDLTDLAKGLGLIRANERLEIGALLSTLPEGGALSIITSGTTLAYKLALFLSATLFTLIFMIWEAERFGRRMRLAYGKQRATRIQEVVGVFNRDMGRYVMLKVLVSALTGIAAYAVMQYFELHFAPILAMLVFLLNFIPYLGSVASTLAPFAVALLQFSGFEKAFIIGGSIILIHQVLGNGVEPQLQGRSLNIAPLVILVTMVYFGWMWGIVGMVVSVPLTAGIRLLLDQFDVTRPVARMMNDV